MADKPGQNAGGDVSSDFQPGGREPLAPPAGSGEVVIAIGDAIKKDERKELTTDGDGNQPLPETCNPSRLTPVVKTKRIGHKLLVSCRMRPMSLRSKAGGASGGGQGSFRKWLSRFYNDATLTPGSEILTVFLAFLGLSVLALFICLVVTKAMMEGCGWSMCIRYFHHHHTAGSPRFSVHTPSHRRGDCVFRRYVPRVQFPFLEIIHDLRSRHSVLIEGRHGHMRCMLFDMSHYVPASDSCPTSYPSSLDERVGVPVAKSKLSRTFPRRYAKHLFVPLSADFTSLKAVIGPVIATRCVVARLQVALLVEARMENRRCYGAQQFLVDQMLGQSDATYAPLRSDAMSDAFSETVVLYENWDKSTRSLGGDEGRKAGPESGEHDTIDRKEGEMEMHLQDFLTGTMIESSVSKIFITRENGNNSLEMHGSLSLSVDSKSGSHQREGEDPKRGIDIFKEILSKVRNRMNLEAQKEHAKGTSKIHKTDKVKSGLKAEADEDKRGFPDVQSQPGPTSSGQAAVLIRTMPGPTTRRDDGVTETNHQETSTGASAEESTPAQNADPQSQSPEKKAETSTRSNSSAHETGTGIGSKNSDLQTANADHFEKLGDLSAQTLSNALTPGAATNDPGAGLTAGGGLSTRTPPPPASETTAKNVFRREAGVENVAGHSADHRLDTGSRLDDTDHPARLLGVLDLTHPALGVGVLSERAPHGARVEGPVDAASVLSGVSVEMEVRRYYMWRGRIIRVCLITKMP